MAAEPKVQKKERKISQEDIPKEVTSNAAREAVSEKLIQAVKNGQAILDNAEEEN